MAGRGGHDAETRPSPDRAVWLLDVDGVINTNRPGWGGPPRRSQVWSDTDRVSYLRLEQLWRLPPLARAISADPMPRGSDCWPLTLAAARAVLAAGRRLVCTDDDAIPLAGSELDELTAGGQALLIAPKSNRGLQPEDLDRIESFAL